MIENLESNIQDLYQEVKTKAEAEGIHDANGWKQMVDLVIEDHRKVGELDDGNPLESIEDKLEAMWPQYEEELNKRVQ